MLPVDVLNPLLDPNRVLAVLFIVTARVFAAPAPVISFIIIIRSPAAGAPVVVVRHARPRFVPDETYIDTAVDVALIDMRMRYESVPFGVCVLPNFTKYHPPFFSVVSHAARSLTFTVTDCAFVPAVLFRSVTVNVLVGEPDALDATRNATPSSATFAGMNVLESVLPVPIAVVVTSLSFTEFASHAAHVAAVVKLPSAVAIRYAIMLSPTLRYGETPA